MTPVARCHHGNLLGSWNGKHDMHPGSSGLLIHSGWAGSLIISSALKLGAGHGSHEPHLKIDRRTQKCLKGMSIDHPGHLLVDGSERDRKITDPVGCLEVKPAGVRRCRSRTISTFAAGLTPFRECHIAFSDPDVSAANSKDDCAVVCAETVLSL
jgi:hypothetical protein